jgi:nucleotide-binding universal stress UspA family protein
MAHKVLIAYDGTESARRALDRAVAIAGADDQVGLISVVPLIISGPRSAGPFAQGDGPAEHRANLQEAVEALSQHGRRPADTIEAVGDPAKAICEAAEEHGYDMIVVGSRNLTGMKRLLLGSVSEKVAHHASCDVLIAK